MTRQEIIRREWNGGRSRGGRDWMLGLLAGVPALLVLGGVLIAAGIARGESAAFPPVIVKTVPGAGDTQVDPRLGEVRVTFSKDMQTDEMWSFVYANPAAFPKIAGEIRYVDSRTCVLPVALEPGKTYGMWINSKEHTAFRDVQHQPAVPYLLVFTTRGS